MDFALNEEQQMLKDTARRFFEKQCSKTVVRELLESRHGHSASIWRQMAELGWLGLPFPEEHGGIGASFLDLAVILEEMGRALLPSPFVATVLLGGYPILEAGTAAQKAALLPLVAAGDLVLTMAWLETAAAYDPEDVRLEAVSEGDHFLLTGTKLFVPYAHVADKILTVARTGSRDGARGLSILLVDRDAPGVECTPLETIDGSKLCEVIYQGVRVPRGDVLGEVDGAGEVIASTLARAAVSECLQLVGGAQVALEMSVEHVKNRVQFGQLVGSFQAVQHHCANLATDLDGARFLAYQAAWLVSEGLPRSPQVAMAKAWVSEACYRVMSRAHQVHGGTGFIAEHDLTLFFKRTAAGELAFGDPTFHYRALASALGL